MISYSLKAFTQFINENQIIETNFIKVKLTIGNEIFPRHHVDKIFRRYEFYTDKNVNVLNKPKEGCLEKMKRKLNNEPPPYHFDYCINKNRCQYTNNDNYIDILVYMMKQSSGYGYRSSGSKVKIQRSDSSINRSISNVNNNINNLILHNNINNSNSKMNSSIKNININNMNKDNKDSKDNLVLRNSVSLSLKDRLNENKSRFDTRSRSFLTATIKSNNIRSITKLESNK